MQKMKNGCEAGRIDSMKLKDKNEELKIKHWGDGKYSKKKKKKLT